jgi:MFS family permease
MTSINDSPRLRPTFNRLAWSNLAAQSAEQIALAAAPIVAVLSLGVGEGQTGLLQTALTLPFILFAIPAGLLADRISRRRLMAGAEALRAAALVAILMLIWLEALSLPLLALWGFVAVCGTVAYSVAAPLWCRRWCRGNHCPRPMHGSNLRARSRSPAARRSAACWWDG